MKVRRGINWRYKDEDGNANFGQIISISEANGTAEVEWDCRAGWFTREKLTFDHYRIKDAFDLAIYFEGEEV